MNYQRDLSKVTKQKGDKPMKGNISTKLFIGMDVSEKSIEIFGLSGKDDKSKSLVIQNTIESVGEFIDGFNSNKEDLVFALETGTHSPWLEELISSKGCKVYVGNARKLRMIWNSDKKSDPEDAKKLAKLAKFDPELLYPIKHRSTENRIDLSVMKCRDVLVEVRKKIMNTVRGQLKSFGIVTSSLESYDFSSKAAKIVPKELGPAMEGLLAQIKQLEIEIRNYDKKVEELCRKYPETKIFRKVKGVGPIVALAYALIIADPGRFKNRKRLAAYIGLVPKQCQSGETDKQLSITKAGNTFLRRLLMQSANYIMGPFGEECDLRDFGTKIKSRGGNIAKKKAKVAVARKLTLLLWKLWISGEEYIPQYKKFKKGKVKRVA